MLISYWKFTLNGDFMKILLIIPSLRNGGAERVAANLSKSFEQRGHDVLVVTFSKGHVDYHVTNHLELDVESTSNKLIRLINVIRRTLKLRRVKENFKPDVSLSLMFGANLINVLTKNDSEVVISSVRTTAKRDSSLIIRLTNQFVYRCSNLIVAVSKGIKMDLIDMYSIADSKIDVIPNFTKFRGIFSFRGSMHSPINLITVGRLEEVKAQWHLFHAINEIKNTIPNISLFVLGKGDLTGYYLKLISELKLHDYIHLVGFQSEVEGYYEKSDIFLLSSNYEGFGNVLIEAMNHGLPIISTDVPYGPKEILNPSGVDLYVNDETIVDEKFGLLVDHRNNPKSNHIGYKDDFIVNQFVDKIQLLIENKELYNHYSRQSLRRVRDFSEDKIVNQWIKLFERLTNE